MAWPARTSQVPNEVALLGEGNEHVGGYPSSLGMLPAHQRLETNHLGRREIDDGLVVHQELAAGQCVAQFQDEREAAYGLKANVGVKVTT